MNKKPKSIQTTNISPSFLSEIEGRQIEEQTFHLMVIRYIETYWLQYNLINIIDITCVRGEKSKSWKNVNYLVVQYLICSFLFSAKNWPSF